jgi:hypothetical protein
VRTRTDAHSGRCRKWHGGLRLLRRRPPGSWRSVTLLRLFEATPVFGVDGTLPLFLRAAALLLLLPLADLLDPLLLGLANDRLLGLKCGVVVIHRFLLSSRPADRVDVERIPVTPGHFWRYFVVMATTRGRPRQAWGLDPIVQSLHELAHNDDGLRDSAALGAQQALLQHPAIRQRLGLGMSPRAALLRALDDVRWFGGGTLTSQEHEAIGVVLNARDSAHVGGKTTPLYGLSWKRRADLASQCLQHTTAEHFVHGRRRCDGTKWSPLTVLLQRLKDALDLLEAPPSPTAPYAWTTAPSAGAAPGGDRLAGTWRGAMRSDWLLQTSETERPTSLPAFMVIEHVGDALDITWYTREGTATAVATRLVDVDGSDRVLCIYEVGVTFSLEATAPVHRGACLMEISAGPRMAGPYWTDRRTYGFLEFGEQQTVIVHGYDEGTELFDGLGQTNGRDRSI